MIRLLIVEDEPTTRNGLRTHVRWQHCKVDQVEVAANPKKAFELCQKEKPDIILSDIRMPGMTGIEMCQEIRKNAPDVQIIFISGYTDKEYFKSAISLSAVSYIEKPVNLLEVEAAVQGAVQRVKKAFEDRHVSQEEALLVRIQKALQHRDRPEVEAIIQDVHTMVQTLSSDADKQKFYYRLGCLVDSTIHQDRTTEQSDAAIRKILEEEGTVENMHRWFSNTILSCTHVEASEQLSEEIEKALVLIAENLPSKMLSVQWLADHVFLSPTYLSFAFKREIGMTPSQYIMQRRIEHAKQLLENEHLSTIQIAQRVGYSDVKYFSRTFKRITGKTPTCYRKSQLW